MPDEYEAVPVMGGILGKTYRKKENKEEKKEEPKPDPVKIWVDHAWRSIKDFTHSELEKIRAENKAAQPPPGYEDHTDFIFKSRREIPGYKAKQAAAMAPDDNERFAQGGVVNDPGMIKNPNWGGGGRKSPFDHFAYAKGGMVTPASKPGMAAMPNMNPMADKGFSQQGVAQPVPNMGNMKGISQGSPYPVGKAVGITPMMPMQQYQPMAAHSGPTMGMPGQWGNPMQVPLPPIPGMYQHPAQKPQPFGKNRAAYADGGVVRQAYAEGTGNVQPDFHSMIVDSANRYGIDPLLLEAIWRQETGHGTSYDFRQFGNPGGIGGPGEGPSRVYGKPGAPDFQLAFDKMADLIARKYGGANANPDDMGARWEGEGPKQVAHWKDQVKKIYAKLLAGGYGAQKNARDWAGYPGRAGKRWAQRQGFVAAPKAKSAFGDRPEPGEPGGRGYIGLGEMTRNSFGDTWSAPSWGRSEFLGQGTGGTPTSTIGEGYGWGRDPGQGVVPTPVGNEGYQPGVYHGEAGGPGDPGSAPRESGGYPTRIEQGGGINQGGGYYGQPMDYYGRDPGGTQGGPTMVDTNWVHTPDGAVPMAKLADAQASTNMGDYLKDYTTMYEKGGSGSGAPTRNVIGTAAKVGGLFLGPFGLGLGGLARNITRMFQPGGVFSRKGGPAPAPAAGGGEPPMPSGSVELPTGGGGTNPFTNYPTGYLGKWYGQGTPGDFGRGDLIPTRDNGRPGGSNFTEGPGPNNMSFIGGGGNTNLPMGGSYFGHTVGNFNTAIGFGGNLGGGGPVNLSALGGYNAMANKAFKNLLFNNANARANHYSDMKYMSNNGFGSHNPMFDLPDYKTYNNTWDYWLHNGLPNGAAVGLPQLQARWEQNHPVVDDNFAPGTGGPITHDLMGNHVVSSAGQTFDFGGPGGRFDRSLGGPGGSRHVPMKQNKAVGGLIHEPDADDKLSGYGTDTVPAALTPGEVVFNKKQLQGIQPRPGHKHKLRSDQLVAIAAAMAHKGKKKAPR